MEQVIELITTEAESCLHGGVIEGLSRFGQLNHDIKVMNICGFIDEDTVWLIQKSQNSTNFAEKED